MIRQKEKSYPYQLFAVLGFVTAAICFYFLCVLGICHIVFTLFGCQIGVLNVKNSSNPLFAAFYPLLR